MSCDEGLAVVFALWSDNFLPDLADRLLELSYLSEEAIESMHFLKLIAALIRICMNLVIVVDINAAVYVLLRVVVDGSGADGILIADLQQIIFEFFEGGKSPVG